MFVDLLKPSDGRMTFPKDRIEIVGLNIRVIQVDDGNIPGFEGREHARSKFLAEPHGDEVCLISWDLSLVEESPVFRFNALKRYRFKN